MPWSGEVVTLSWQMPWEQARVQRLLNVVVAGWLRAAEVDYSQEPAGKAGEDRAANPTKEPPSFGRFLVRDWQPPAGGPGVSLSREQLARLIDQSILADLIAHHFWMRNLPDLNRACSPRGMRLKLALLLYQDKEKKPAPGLEALVPGYFPQLPLDPFTGRPFHYRISSGEKIPIPAGKEWQVQAVPAGWGILWSGGPGGLDESGTKQDEKPLFGRSPPQGADRVWLIPQWGKP